MQARAQEILREKLTSIVGTYDETSREIQSTLTQMDEAFELLMTKPDRVQRGRQHLAAQDEEGLEWEDVTAEDAANGTQLSDPVISLSFSAVQLYTDIEETTG